MGRAGNPQVEQWRLDALEAASRMVAIMAGFWTVFLFTDLHGSRWIAVTLWTMALASAVRPLGFHLRAGLLVAGLSFGTFGVGVTAGAAPACFTSAAMAVVAAGTFFGAGSAVGVWLATIALMALGWSLAARDPSYGTEIVDIRRPLNLVRMLASHSAMSSVLLMGIVVVVRRLGTTVEELKRTAEAEHRARVEAEKANERREQIQRQMAEAQKHELMGQLAGSIAHDINNALQFLTFQAERLGRGPLTAEQATAMSRDILEICDQASGLAKQMLTLGQRAVLDREVLDLGSELALMARALGRTLPSNVALRLEHEEGLCVHMDRGQLKQALLNLTLNSIHAMPDGGELRLGARRSAEGYVEVLVRDTGTGMDEETRAKVFEPFFTTKGTAGTGLGLASVKAIVEQHRGQVQLESEPGRGTEVRLRLPAHACPGASSTDEPRAEHDLRGCRVLVVDDDPRVRRAIAQMLGAAGARVLEARDANAALEIAATSEVDLLCTDAIMPGMPTRELIDRIRARDPSFPVLVCSAYVESELLRHGIETESIAYLAKPFSAQQLVAKVAALHGGPRSGERTNV